MRIRNKITLVFCLLTGTLSLLTFLFIYFSAWSFSDRLFFQSLEERAIIVAQSALDRDEMNETFYREIRKKHLEVLEDEREYVFPFETLDLTHPDLQQVPQYFLKKVRQTGKATFKHNRTYCLGILQQDNEGEFLVLISAKNSYGEEELNNLLKSLMLAFLLGLIVIYFIGRYYAGRVLQPLVRMDRDMKEIRATNLHLRLPTTGTPDELNRLAETFNDMLDRLEQAFQVQTNFVNNASHELRNPLTAILGETEVALIQERSSEEYQRVLTTIESEANRLHLLVESLLNMAQTDNQSKDLLVQALRIEELIIQVLRDFDIRRPDHRVCLEILDNPVEEGFWIRGNSVLLRSAFTNLLENACKFSGETPVKLSVGPSARGVKVAIQDFGVGIPASDLNHISEPFYRAPNARKFAGSGIGLPLSRKIFQMHGARMSITSEEEKGTLVEVFLPYAPLNMSFPEEL